MDHFDWFEYYNFWFSVKNNSGLSSFMGWCPPFLGPVARQFLGWSPRNPAPLHGGLAPRETTHRVSLWCLPCRRLLCRARFMASTPLVLQQSRTLRCGVQAGVSRRTRAVSDETAHAPSLSQRVPAVLQHCVQTLCCGVERRARLHSTECSIPGARTRDHWSHCGSSLHFSQRHLRTTHCKQYLVSGVKKTVHGPLLVSSQGVVSPPLPNGCGWELHGLQLYRDQKGQHLVYSGKGTDCTTNEGKASGRTDRPLPSLLDLRRGQGPLQTSGGPRRRTR